MSHELLPVLLERLFAVQAALQANLVSQAGKLGLSVTQASVAQDLAQHPGSSLQDVCARLGWPKSTVSRVVDDLVNRGLALREVPPHNRRTVLLSLAHQAVGCFPSDLSALFPGAGNQDSPTTQALIEALDRIEAMLKAPK